VQVWSAGAKVGVQGLSLRGTRCQPGDHPAWRTLARRLMRALLQAGPRPMLRVFRAQQNCHERGWQDVACSHKHILSLNRSTENP